MTTATFAPTWYGDRLLKAAWKGTSAYGNHRYRLHFESGHELDTAPGFQLPRNLTNGEPVEFTLDPSRRVNDIRTTTTVPPMRLRLGKRQYAVLRELTGKSDFLYLKRSERITVQRSLLRHGLIAKQDGSLVLTPGGRSYILWP